MATKLTRGQTETALSVTLMQSEQIEVCIVGTSPLICNSMSAKARFQILFPPKRKSASEKATSLKHNPIQEFRASPYRMRKSDAPTVIGALPIWFKQGIGVAALDTPGMKRTQLERLIWVDWDHTPLWGVPHLFMAITRSADINRTPDIRTRALLPEWAVRLVLRFQTPMLNAQTVLSLLANAGVNSGVGDWRQQKGSGSYGGYRIVPANDPDFVRICSTQGREAQADALENPVCYDDDSAQLLALYSQAASERGLEVPQ